MKLAITKFPNLIDGKWVNYKVDEKNRIVIASLKKERFDYESDINRHSCAYLTTKEMADIIEKVAKNPIISAKARCSKDDVFDANTGKRIAYNRLLVKYARKKLKILDKYYAYQSNVLDDVNDTAVRLERITLTTECYKTEGPKE